MTSGTSGATGGSASGKSPVEIGAYSQVYPVGLVESPSLTTLIANAEEKRGTAANSFFSICFFVFNYSHI